MLPLNPVTIDEAGYETLVGLEESLRPSQIYTEKALCMAKGFVSYALNHTLNGIDHIKNWVYVDPSGPQLLQKVVEESTALLDRKKDNDVLSTGMEDPNRDRLSAGAEVLLKRYLGTLQQMLQDGLATQQNSKPSDSLGPQQQGQANPNPQMQQEDAMDWSPNP